MSPAIGVSGLQRDLGGRDGGSTIRRLGSDIEKRSESYTEVCSVCLDRRRDRGASKNGPAGPIMSRATPKREGVAEVDLIRNPIALVRPSLEFWTTVITPFTVARIHPGLRT